MKKTLKIFSVLLSLMLIFAMTACSKTEEASGSGSSAATDSAATTENSEEVEEEVEEDLIEQDYSDVSFPEEDDEAEISLVKTDPSKFFGTWESTSGRSEYLYGNVEITVNKGGTWKGNITEEPLNGTWEVMGDRLHMNNEMFSFDLAFESSGKLLLIETTDEGELHTVLTKK